MKKILLSLVLLLALLPVRAQLGLTLYPLGKMVGVRTSGIVIVDSRRPGYSGLYVDSYLEFRSGLQGTINSSASRITLTPELLGFMRVGGRYPISLLVGIGGHYGYNSSGSDYYGGNLPLVIEWVPKGERFPMFTIKAETDLLYHQYNGYATVELRPMIGVSCLFDHKSKDRTDSHPMED